MPGRMIRAGIATLLIAACAKLEPPPEPARGTFVMVLGIAQDAGYPQAACRKACCRQAWKDPSRRRRVACLAIVSGDRRWLVDCTPDFREQLRALDEAAPVENSPGIDGILLTHAHIGHYAGLVHLGREVMGAKEVLLHVMPRMQSFLTSAGPWSLMVSEKHVAFRPLTADAPVTLSDTIRVTPVEVPHRDEFSETVGFRIEGPKRSVLYIPDIDKWERWDRRIEEQLKRVDVAYLDGTFFADGEIKGRDMSQIPHPFIEETLHRLAALPATERAKVRFIHLNHTNPALDPQSDAARFIRAAGLAVARQGERIALD